MANNQTKFKNIIFDLGAVIINIDPDRTNSAIKRLVGPAYSKLKAKADKENIFQLYEKGTIDSRQFRAFFQEFVDEEIEDDRFDLAWNAMLMDIPSPRIDLLLALRNDFRIFMLSNTNEIHMKRINHYIHSVYGLSSFDRIFEKVYLSYELGKRKPEPGIYELIFSENNLVPEETLFIDDSEENVVAAHELGLLTHHLKSDKTLEQLF